jgi:hypothetical protein
MRGYFGFYGAASAAIGGAVEHGITGEKLYNASTSEICEIKTTANVLRQMWEKQTC